MDSLKLQCSQQRCNIDGTTEMKLEKCVLTNATPCYYLIVKANEPDDAWKKFNSFVSDKSKTV